ncbi:MAG: acetylornithine transaminase [Anaerolineae bacterium]|nr:acetylornithine transaminase [Anaerolineae bacterium]
MIKPAFQPDAVSKEADFVLGTYPRPPFVLARGEGMYVYDTDGKAYLDFGAGIAVNALGHANQEIVEAVSKQAARLSHVSNLYHSAPQADLAEKLCQLSFADKVFFSNSGAEAVEAAIKFSRAYARHKYGEGKTKIVAFENGFHGRTFGALSITNREKYQQPFRPLLPGVTFAPFNTTADALDIIDQETCAVVVELVQGEGGVHVASKEFIQQLRQRCDQTGALLVFDEIQTGVGRTGKLWAYQHYGIQPDILAAAKALGGGLPIGATLLTGAVAQALGPGDHGSTFGGGPVVCRAAQVVLDHVSRPEFLEHVVKMGAYIVERLGKIKSPKIKQMRGRGLIIGVEIDGEAKAVIEQGYARGVLMLSAGPNVIRLLPPLIVSKKDIDHFISVFEKCLAKDQA